MMQDMQTFDAADRGRGTERERLEQYRVLAAYDITLTREGEEYQPEDGALEVVITDEAIEQVPESKLQLWHIHDDNTIEQIEGFSVEGDSVRLMAESFSVYLVVEYTLTQIVTASDGNEYLVSVTYDNETGVPEDAELEVTELSEGSEGYEAYVQKAVEALGTEGEEYGFARAFDISLIDPATGEHCQPAKPLAVSVRLLNEYVQEGDAIDVVHFPDSHAENADGEASVTELLAASVNGEAVEFESTGFSVYVIIDHEGDSVVKNPRVEFHYIDSGFTDNNDGTYTANPFRFVNKHNETQISQILKNGETLEMIANPPNRTDDLGNETSFFYGWYKVELYPGGNGVSWSPAASDWTGTITYTWPEDMKVDDEIPCSITWDAAENDADGNGKTSVGDTVAWKIGTARGTAVLDSKGTAHVYLAPAFEDFYFVNYHMGNKEADEGLRNNLLTRRLVVFGTGKTSTVRIGDIKCPSPDPEHQIFSGWETVKLENGTLVKDVYYRTVDVNGDEIPKTVNMDGTDAAFSAGEGYYVIVRKDDSTVRTQDLYPVFAEARWLHYDTGASNNGAQYVASAYRLTHDDGFGTAFTSLSTSTRPGYDLAGWYVNAAMEGSEIKNLNGAYTYTADVNGSTVTINYNQAIQLTDANGNFVNAVKGKYFYSVKTEVANGDSKIYMTDTDPAGNDSLNKLFEVTAGGELYMYKPLNSLKVGARWEAKTVDYTVVYWLENANDDDYTLMYYKVLQGNAGATTAATETSTSDTFVREGTTYYPYNEYKLRYAHLSTDQDKDKAGDQSGIQQQTIAGDGSTIVNVYYDRNCYKLRFDIGFSKTSGSTTNYYVSNLTNSYNSSDDRWENFLTNNYVNLGTTNPFTASEYNGTYTSGQYTIYYYDISAKYGENILDRYPGSQSPKRNTNNTTYSFVGWIAQPDSYIWETVMSSVKGTFETMSEQLILTGGVERSHGTARPADVNDYKAVSLDGEYKTNTKTGELGITQEFRCRYKSGSGMNYLYRIYLADPETGLYPSEPTSKVIITAGSGSYPNQQTPPTYYGYTLDEAKVLTSATDTTGVTPGGQSGTGSYSAYAITELTNAKVGTGMIMVFRFQPNEHHISYKYGSGAPTDLIGKEFGTEGRSGTQSVQYKYNQSLANANVNQDEAVANTPVGYKFDGWYENPDGVGSRFVFSTELPSGEVVGTKMPDGDIVLYAVYKPLRYRITIDPNGAEIDHIDHTGAQYTGVYNGIPYNHAPFNRTATSERLEDSGYDRSKSTYFNGTYDEMVGEYAVSRHYVPIGDTAAEIYKEAGGRVYYYINFQSQVSDGSGLPSDLRDALYIDVTENEGELLELYDFWHWYAQTNWELMPSAFTGMTAQDLSYQAWKNLYLAKKEGSGEPQLYRKCNSKENWVFLGWYKDNEVMSYDFNQSVKGEFHLQAHWRLDGGYKIQYIPEFSLSTGDIVNGRMENWVDPVETSSTNEPLSYTDGAVTTIYKQPTDLTFNGSPVTDNSLIFRGWQIVSVTVKQVNGQDVNTYTPLQPGVYYDPGDNYVVDVQYADTNNIIHMQAVYEPKESSYRRPEITNLTLDANSGYLVDADGNELTDPANLDWEGSGTVLMDPDTEQIAFGDIQSNTALRLYQYATKLTQDMNGNPLDPAGTNYFVHPDGYLLLGFDDASNEGDYIATYPADSILSVQRTDRETIYAVWEPMVYITFVNDTAIPNINFNGGNVTFNITSDSSEALQVITQKNGVYVRVPLTSLDAITLAPGEQRSLVFPKGDEKNIKINGVNLLGVGKQLNWNTSINGTDTATAADNATVTYTHNTDCEHELAHGKANNTMPFNFAEKLLTDENGLVVTFTAKEVAYALLCEDNFPAGFSGGGTQEYGYGQDYVENENEHHEQLLPNPSTLFGYEFKGWAYTANAKIADIPAEPEADRKIADLNSFFMDAANSGYLEHVDTTTVRRLYAVWAINNEAGYVYVYKSVPEPGNQKTPFTFNVSISGTYQATGKQDQTVSDSGSFTLMNGEYAVLHSECVPEIGKIQTDITIHNADRTVKEDANGDTITYRLLAQPPTPYQNGTFNSTENFSVTETAVPYYSTAIDVRAQTTGHPITKTDAERKISWNSAETGGTVIYTNTRETSVITVKKVLVSNESTGTFEFHASYTDGDSSTNDERTVNLDDFSLVTPAGEKRLTIPKGVNLTISEYGTNLVDYETTAVHTAPTAEAMTVTPTESVSGSATTYTRAVGLDEVTVDDTITFTNTLIRYPVKLIKVDQTWAVNPDGSNVVEAFFKLDDVNHNLGTNLYPNDINKGVFYLSTDSGREPFYAGHTYTLEETWTEDGYEGLEGPVSIKVSGKTGSEFTFTDKATGNPVTDLRATFNTTDNVWEIRVRNQAVKEITVVAELSDPLFSQREFNYSYSYTYDGETVNDSFTLSPTTSTSAKKVLLIPVNATNLVITEDVTQTVNEVGDTIFDTYDIKVNGTTADKAEDVKHTISQVVDNETVTFSHKRKEVEIEVSKIVIAETTTGTYDFEVSVTHGSLPVKDYTVFDNNTTDTSDDLNTMDSGKVNFTLDHRETITVKIPVGATITVEEKNIADDIAVFMTMPGVKVTLVDGRANKVQLIGPKEKKTIHVFNIPSICKVTDDAGNLLYVLQEGWVTPDDPSDDIYIPAIFPTIDGAFNGRDYEKTGSNIGGLGNYWSFDGDTPVKYSALSYQIQMLDDYPVPDSDVVEVDPGYTLVFTTADTGATDGYPFRRSGEYPGTLPDGANSSESIGRAVLTRPSGATAAFFTVNKEQSTTEETTFTMSELILDGCDSELNAKGGCLTAYNTAVAVDHCVIYRFDAKEGGAVYTTGTSLTVTNSVFNSCKSKNKDDGCGGGGINTRADTLSISDSQFISCTAVNQAGAVFQLGQIKTDTDTGETNITGSMNITDTTFTNCSANAAGAVEADLTTVTLTDCTFVNCNATSRNGGAFNTYYKDSGSYSGTGESYIPDTGSSLTVSNCTFQGCSANQNGGGLRSMALQITLTDCTFEDDTSTNKSCTANQGGGVAFDNNKSSITVNGCTFSDCTATTSGGAVYSTGSTTVNGCTFSDCNANTNGGGVHCTGTTLKMQNNGSVQTTLTDCTAGNNGGGVYFSGGQTSRASLSNVVFDGHESLSDTTANAQYGGAVYLNNGQLRMTDNCVIRDCTAAESGGAIYNNSETYNKTVDGVAQLQTVYLTNCTINGHDTLSSTQSNANAGGAIYMSNGRLFLGSTTVQSCTAVTDGGAIYLLLSDDVKKGASMILSGGSIINCAAQQNGGAIYNASKKSNNVITVDLQGNFTVSGNDAANGGAIYMDYGILKLPGGTISGNSASTAGAGIYLAEGSTLNISGNPSFGGTGVTNAETGALDNSSGNLLTGTISATNGGAAYTRARQDIYIAGYAGTVPAASLAVTGNLTGATGSVWVWAETLPHIRETEQFAVMTGGTWTGLSAFRDARTDADTGAGSEFLRGMTGTNPSYVYWGSNGIDVKFKKIDSFGKPLGGAVFTLYTDKDCTTAYQKSGSNVTAASTVSGTGENAVATVSFDKIPNGVYYMKDTAPAGYTNSETYILLVGQSYLTVPTTTDGTLWAAGAVMEDITQDRINAQTTQYNTDFGIDKYVIFQIDSTSGKAVAETDIAKYGIMNFSAVEHKVILRKVAESTNASLEGAKFRIFRADFTEIINADYVTSDKCYVSTASGVYFIDKLPDGIYYAVETGAPTKENGSDTSAYSENADKVFELEVKDGMATQLSSDKKISSGATDTVLKTLYDIIHPTATP